MRRFLLVTLRKRRSYTLKTRRQAVKAAAHNAKALSLAARCDVPPSELQDRFSFFSGAPSRVMAMTLNVLRDVVVVPCCCCTVVVDGDDDDHNDIVVDVAGYGFRLPIQGSGLRVQGSRYWIQSFAWRVAVQAFGSCFQLSSRIIPWPSRPYNRSCGKSRITFVSEAEAPIPSLWQGGCKLGQFFLPLQPSSSWLQVTEL